jgi:hypothetical protein
MTDDEWEAQRQRAMLAAFQTGRPVFADSDGVLRFADGAQETIGDEVGTPPAVTTRQLSWWGRMRRWLRGGS